MKKYVFGILIILAGVLLIGFSQGFLPIEYKHIFFSWQMFLIALGLINIVGKDSWFMGVILLLTGGFFILPELSNDFVLKGISFFPVLLILIGLLIIFKRKPSKKHFQHWNKKHHESVVENGFIYESTVFGGNKRIISPCEFKGAKLSYVFGGSELDLTQTTLQEGNTYIDLDCVFGGVKLIVPNDWNVQIQIKAVMGGFSDNRKYVKAIDNSKNLIIRGSAVFGGGEIKSY